MSAVEHKKNEKAGPGENDYPAISGPLSASVLNHAENGQNQNFSLVVQATTACGCKSMIYIQKYGTP